MDVGNMSPPHLPSAHSAQPQHGRKVRFLVEGISSEDAWIWNQDTRLSTTIQKYINYYIYIRGYIEIYTWIIHLCKIMVRNPKQQITAGCLNSGRFQFFSPFRWVFAVSKPANTCKMTKMQSLFGGRKNAASNNS